jgi:cytoskeletal protein RodZ
MTTRHQLRIGSRRLGRERAAIDATPAPPVGETLLLARERKGVDLYRAERDTKIRLRYLSALEDGAYDELPPPVYTKGFLRNYAIYLGIDPDEILERWRDEMDAVAASERLSVAPPPQPIAAPGRQITLTPGMFVGGLVVVVILGFIAYLGLQLMRYAEVTPVSLTQPSNAFSTIDAETTALEGISGPGAQISINGPGDAVYDVSANEEGEWSKQVDLARGQNDFTIIARDPVTGRDSPRLVITIIRPLPVASAIPSAAASTPPPAALTLSLTTPAEGSVSTDGNVIVSGTTSGSRITIESDYLGQPGTASPLPVSSPAPDISPTPGGSLPPIGPARDVTIAEGGAFSETLTFAIGRWQLTITTFDIGVAPITVTRTVSVEPPVVSGMQLVVTIRGRASWVRAVADGEQFPGLGGKTLRDGDTYTITAANEICLRAGNAGSVALNLNGLDIGVLGGSGQVGSWVFRPGQGPERTDNGC